MMVVCAAVAFQLSHIGGGKGAKKLLEDLDNNLGGLKDQNDCHYGIECKTISPIRPTQQTYNIATLNLSVLGDGKPFEDDQLLFVGYLVHPMINFPLTHAPLGCKTDGASNYPCCEQSVHPQLTKYFTDNLMPTIS